MKINTAGITFDYHGDTITWYWPWMRLWENIPYHSKFYNQPFKDFRSYWVMVGTLTAGLRTKKLKGLSADEMAKERAKYESQFGPVILIMNMDPSTKPDQFWTKLGKDRAKELNSDYCLLYPENLDEGSHILRNTPAEFADCYLYYNDEAYDSNIPDVVK